MGTLHQINSLRTTKNIRLQLQKLAYINEKHKCFHQVQYCDGSKAKHEYLLNAEPPLYSQCNALAQQAPV